VSAARLAPGEARGVWQRLITIGLTPGAAAGRFGDFRHELVRAERAAFPVEGAAAEAGAAGFRAFGLAFAYAGEDRRALIEPVLREAAKCLDELLNGERRALARRAHLAQSPDDRE
jgi:hypothetical protein